MYRMPFLTKVLGVELKWSPVFYTMFYVIIAFQIQSQITDCVSIVFPVITLRSAVTKDWLWKAVCI